MGIAAMGFYYLITSNKRQKKRLIQAGELLFPDGSWSVEPPQHTKTSSSLGYLLRVDTEAGSLEIADREGSRYDPDLTIIFVECDHPVHMAIMPERMRHKLAKSLRLAKELTINIPELDDVFFFDARKENLSGGILTNPSLAALLWLLKEDSKFQRLTFISSETRSKKLLVPEFSITQGRPGILLQRETTLAGVQQEILTFKQTIEALLCLKKNLAQLLAS